MNARDDQISVLVVDDRPANLVSMQALLQPLGVRVLPAGSGLEALRVLLRYDVALVLLDVEMPGLDGVETARLIRARPRTRATPIVFLTAVHGDADAIFAGYAVGAVDYILKPIVPEILRAKVGVFIELHRKTLALNREHEAAREADRRAAEARAANRAKMQFLAHMSHELRTPLNGLIGMTDLLVETAGGDEARRYALGARQAARSLLRILNEILDFSRIEAHKTSLVTADFDVRDVFGNACELLAAEAFAKRLQFTCHIDRGVPARLHGDAGRLRQVLMNLGSNAIKFTEAGAVRLRVRGRWRGGDGRYTLEGEVEDTGIGIAPERLDAIFEPFVQADTSSTRRYGGTGLGLTISRTLVRMMGGELRVSSELGRGTRASFAIVLADAAAGASEAPAAVAGLSQGPVLVVSGEGEERQAMVEALAFCGATPVEARSADEAAVLLRAPGSPPPVAIFVDMDLPDLGGEALIAHAVRAGLSPPLRLFAVQRPSAGARISSGGGVTLLPKPLSAAALRTPAPSLQADPGRAGGSGPGAGGPPSARAARGAFRVLVAEDDDVGREVASSILRRAGYAVLLARDGGEAVRILRGEAGPPPVHAAVLDIEMPGADGLAITKMLRAGRLEPTLAHLPLVAMTAHVTPADEARCLEAGMNSFLAKPIDAPRLLAVLDGLLLSSAAADPERSQPEAGSSAVPVAACWTPAALRRVLGGDEQACRRARERFVEVARASRDALRRATEERELARGTAHKLRGAALTVGAAQLAARAAEVEEQAPAAEAQILADAVERLLSSIDDVIVQVGPQVGGAPALTVAEQEERGAARAR